MDLSKKGDKKFRAIIDQMQSRVTHSIKRAFQRYEVTIDEYQYWKLVEQIVNKKAVFIQDLGSGKSIWKVRHNEQIMYAVYQECHMSICTFLSREMV